jgi:hypothetical protein
VALQGTLDTFSLPDVLRLLATTGKSGCLHIDGDRGRGRVWIDDGAVVDAAADRALGEASVDEVIFEMLRFDRGSFSFAAEEQSSSPREPVEVEGALRRAGQLLDEWRELEVVVPSLNHRVAMAPELTVEQVTIDSSRWEALVAIAAGRSVGELAESLHQGELGISRMVSDLVELGVAVVEPPGSGRVTGRRNVTDISGRSGDRRSVRKDPTGTGRRDPTGGGRLDPGRRDPAPSMPLSDGISSGINWAQSAEAGTLPDAVGDDLGRPIGARPGNGTQYDTGGPHSNGRALLASGGGGLTVAAPTPNPTPTPAGGNHLEIAPKTGRRASTARSGRGRRSTPTGPTPTTSQPTSAPSMPTRNGTNGTNGSGPSPLTASPAYPASDLAERAHENGRALDTNGRAARGVVPQSPVDTTRSPIIPPPDIPHGPGPAMPSPLDAGRLGPSPRGADTGQYPAVNGQIGPEVSWAAEDNEAPAPLSSPFASLGQAAPAPPPGAAPGRLLASQPVRQTQPTASIPAPPPNSMATPAPMPGPAGGTSVNPPDGEAAYHVAAMSPDARAAVEATIGKAGGGVMVMAPEQAHTRGQLLGFLATVRA